MEVKSLEKAQNAVTEKEFDLIQLLNAPQASLVKTLASCFHELILKMSEIKKTGHSVSGLCHLRSLKVCVVCVCFQGGQCIYSSKEGSDESPDMNSLLHHLRPYFLHANNRMNSHVTCKAVLNDFIQVKAHLKKSAAVLHWDYSLHTD